MINSLKIDNFKSLIGFEMTLAKLTCLVGLNGAGKSTVLQAIDFLAHVMTGDIETWLGRREWSPGDVLCRLPERPHKRRIVEFEIQLQLDDERFTWEGRYNADKQRCTWEQVSIDGEEAFMVSENRFRFARKSWRPVQFTYLGSILSRLKISAKGDTAKRVVRIKEFLQKLRSSDLLAPHLMRQRARKAEDIGVGGETLSAFLHGLQEPEREKLDEWLKSQFSSTFDSVCTTSLRSGWKKLSVVEEFSEKDDSWMETEARHVNDGLLRQLAIIAQTLTNHQFLLFDEIENGMNQEVVGRLITVLREAPQQIVVTTHSPLIINFLPEEEARDGVILLYRTPEGFTRATPYFDLPITEEKLGILRPGEVYSDTPLDDVVESAIRCHQASCGSPS